MAEAEAYDEQQAELRRQHGFDEDDLEPRPEDFQIPEINPEIFKDVEPVLFRGFLTVAATINEVPFVFKSMNHHEFEALAMIHRPRADTFHGFFLAYGVLVADGMNMLKDREERLPDLAEFFQSLPKHAQQRVVRHLSEVNRRANRAVILVEPYVMESRSRLRWAQVRGLDLSTTAVTGFEASQTLGLNWGQLMWRALNHLEDQRENAEREWENAKFVASAMAGKGMQKIYSTDKRRRQDARTEQLERREKILRLALFNEPLDGPAPQGNMTVARTTTELLDQLEHDLKGEKDWHDQVIEDHERRVREGMQARARSIQTAREAHVREYGDRPILSSTSISGLTRADVQKRLEERRAEYARSLAAQQKHPELSDPKYAEFADKWLQQPIVRQPPSVMPIDPRQRPRQAPFRRDG